MASKDFKQLFDNTAKKVANNEIIDNVGDIVVIKHYFESEYPPHSLHVPVVKNDSDKELFLSKMEELHNLRMEFYSDAHSSPTWKENQLEEFILAHTFFRATFQDFEDPINYLNREISFLKNDYIKKIEENGPFLYIGTLTHGKVKNVDIKVALEKNLVGYEANNCLKITLMNEEFKSFHLPDVHFDLDSKVAHIKGIQQSRIHPFDKNDSWAKKMNKVTYKANEGNEESLPPTHLLSLVIAISFLQNLGYEKFAFPTHHPIRTIYYNGYHLKDIHKRYTPLIKKGFETKEKYLKKLEEKMKEIDQINFNITDRFLKMVLAYINHFPETEILDYGDDFGYFIINTSKQKEYDDDHILHCIHNGMYKNIKRKLS